MFTTFTIFVAALALFTTPSVAKSCITPTPTPGLSPSPSPSKAPEWYIGRYFYHSSDAPIASVLNKQTKFISLTNTVISMLDNVERTIRFEQLYRLNAQNDENIQLRKPQICNLEDGQWAVSAQQQIALRGYTEKPVVSCVTDFIESDDNEETRQYEHIYEIARIIRDNAPRIAKAANTNFSNPDAIFDWPYNTKTEDCTINVLGAYRIQRDWLLNIGITNEKKENYTAEFSRHYINEGIGRDGKVGRMKLFKRPDNDAKNQTHVLIEGATTMMVSHNGIAAPAVIKPIPFEENLAVRRALDKADLYSQQVTDATSPSSIAILVLPLFLNLIPIALLADVSTRSTFLYALLSDVLTVIPLSIKGIELISIGSATFIGSVVRISSTSDGSESEAAAAEMYGALCVPKKDVLPTGIVFLTVSLVFLVAGLIGELVAKKYATKRRRAMYGRMSVSSSNSGSSGSARDGGGGSRNRARCRSGASNASVEARGAEHVGMELDSYDDGENGEHLL